jgi:hypothetical protein
MGSSERGVEPVGMSSGSDGRPVRPAYRGYVAGLVIVSALGLGLGTVLKTPDQIGANDISRWCTVWSLLERGTYAIDECPWQAQTQDKVWMREPFGTEGQVGRKRFYSSKPPLLPTLIAGILYPFRAATGVPLEAVVEQRRTQRLEVQSLDYVPKENQKVVRVTDSYKVLDITSPEPYRWPAHVLYFDPILVLFNVVPMGVFLVLFARLLDRYAANDWAWMFSLVAAAFGTNLLIFVNTLNNHTIAAFSAFFALYAWLRIERTGGSAWDYALAGFFASFAVCNEYPAAAFAGLLGLRLLWRSPSRTFGALLPAALLPAVAFVVTLYLATGGVVAYSQFNVTGPEAPYRYPGSYWLSPLGADALDEPKWEYLFHLLVGHHGIF